VFTSPCVHWSRGPKGSGCPRLLSRPGPSQAATSVSFSPRTASSSALPRHEAFIDCDLHFMSMLPAPACQHSQRTRPRGKRSSLLFNTQWSTCTRAMELPGLLLWPSKLRTGGDGRIGQGGLVSSSACQRSTQSLVWPQLRNKSDRQIVSPLHTRPEKIALYLSRLFYATLPT
jgi:hypothetical protein